MAYQTLIFLHVICVILLMGGSMLGARVMGTAKKFKGTRELAVIGQIASAIPMFTLPGSLGAMLTGTALVWRQGYGFGTPWVVVAYVVWTTSFLVAIGGLGRTLGAAAPLLQKAIAEGKEEAPEYHAVLTGPTVFWAMRTLEVLSLILIIDMVFKPGA